MCITCGCSEHEHEHDHDHEHNHPHDKHAEHHHEHEHAHRTIQIEKDILSKNDIYAQQNREHLKQKKALALNLVSSPGSGKTTLLVKTINLIKSQHKIVVVEGDQQTSNDAERILATGVPAEQINTGKGCHLDAHMVGHALEHLGVAPASLVFIENVGNLVCPADFDLGEYAKVAILSVTEGEDKPLKYPNIFANSSLMIINKIDLLPYLDFDLDACVSFAKRVNPNIEIIMVSAKTGQGMDTWITWLQKNLAKQ